MKKGVARQSRLFTESEFQTPPAVADYMASLLPYQQRQLVLEPTPGEGNLVRALQKTGCAVTAENNFFDLLKIKYPIKMETPVFDAVVMNPPWSWELVQNVPDWLTTADKNLSCAQFFLQNCLDFAPVVIALLPWNSLLDSPKSTKIIKHYGLVSVTGLGRNVFKRVPVRTGVYNLQRGYQGKTELIIL